MQGDLEEGGVASTHVVEDCVNEPPDAQRVVNNNGNHPPSGGARDVKNHVNKPPDSTPRHIDPLLSTIINLIRRWFISVMPQERTTMQWPFDWDLRHITGRDAHQDLLGIRLPLSFDPDSKIPNLGPNAHFFGHGSDCRYPERVIHSIITLVTLVRIAESLSSVQEPDTEHTVKTMITLLSALETVRDIDIESCVFYERNAANGATVQHLAGDLKEFISSRADKDSAEGAKLRRWTINICDAQEGESRSVHIVRAVNAPRADSAARAHSEYFSYKGHLGVLRSNGARIQPNEVLEAMAAFAVGRVERSEDIGRGGDVMASRQRTPMEARRRSPCPPVRALWAKRKASCANWIASIPSAVEWIFSICFSWMIAFVALLKGELQQRREHYALITHVGVQGELNELIAAARQMRPWKWFYVIIIYTVIINFIGIKFQTVALGQSIVLILLRDEISWIQKLREVHGTEAVALALLEHHSGHYLRAKFDECCVDLRVPLAMALVTVYVAFTMAPSQVMYETSGVEFRIVPSDSKAAIPVVAAFTCGTTVILIHAMNIAMTVAPRLLVSHIRALAGGTLSGSTGLPEAVLNYLNDKLYENFGRWATSVTDQAAIMSRLMWPSVVPWPDDETAKKTEMDLRKRMQRSIMHDASTLARRSMPIENQGMFTAMVNHELDIAGIVAHELACSGSDAIMKSDLYASFLCDCFPDNYQTFMERFYGGCIRAKTSYKLDLKRNVYSVQIDVGRFIIARDSIFVGAIPPAPTTYSVASAQAAESTFAIRQTLELWNAALRRASDVTDSGSYYFDYHKKARYSLGKVGFSDTSPSSCLVPLWATNGEDVEVATMEFCERSIKLSKMKYG